MGSLRTTQALLGIAVLVATVGIAAALPDGGTSLDDLERRSAEVVRVLPPWTSVFQRRFCDDSLAPPSLFLEVSEQERQELPQALTDLGWTRVEDRSQNDDDVEVVGFERSMNGWTAELGWIVVEDRRPVSALGWSVVEERPVTARTVVSVVLADAPPSAC